MDKTTKDEQYRNSCIYQIGQYCEERNVFLRYRGVGAMYLLQNGQYYLYKDSIKEIVTCNVCGRGANRELVDINSNTKLLLCTKCSLDMGISISGYSLSGFYESDQKKFRELKEYLNNFIRNIVSAQ
jgi:hypothetical protein